MIDGIYKKKAPKLARANMGDPLFWDDLYFDSVVQAYIWATMRIAERDPKAAITQEGIFYQTLAEATSSENLELGEPQISPSEALSVGRGGLGGGFTGILWGS